VRVEELFPIGARVWQRYSVSDEIGRVVGHEPGRVLVTWPAWGRTGRYMASSLQRVDPAPLTREAELETA
jgi:hypothetical protein